MTIPGRWRFAGLFLLLATVSVRGDDEVAALTAKADKGDVSAQFQLGQLFAAGKSVAKDDAKARQWFLKAAAQDHAGAQVSLGSIYAHGFGVPLDWAESIKWYRRAALQGDRIAQHNLGLDYNYGHGVTRDYARAAQWFRLGAEQGQPRCQYNLGLLCEEGKGVPQSDVDALILYTLATAQPNQNHIFGEAKAKEVAERRDKLTKKLSPEQVADAQRRVRAFQALVELHPRRFGAPGTNTGLSRGWYVWLKFDPDTWEAEVKHETSGEIWKVRVLPWASTYRYLNYGVRPDALLPGERVNMFFCPDENHKRGYLTHFQDELCQMKGHGHYWQAKVVLDDGGTFTAVAMAGDKPLDGKEVAFNLDPSCRVWQGGKRVERATFKADKRYLTWCYRKDQRVVMLMADDASLEAIKKDEGARLGQQIAAEGIAGRVESVDGRDVHFLVFGTHWAQAGTLKEGQTVKLTTTGRGFHPTGMPVPAKVTFRKNRGQYGSGVTDLVLQVEKEDDAARLNGWLGEKVVRLLAVMP